VCCVKVTLGDCDVESWRPRLSWWMWIDYRGSGIRSIEKQTICWRKAVVMPILIPGKDCSLTNSYRSSSVSTMAMFHQCFICAILLRKWSAIGNCFKCDPLRKWHQWYSKHSWSVCLDITLCRKRCHFLRLLEHWHHWTLIIASSKSSLTLGSGEWNFLLFSQDPACTFHVSVG
jgi:hypothetical protein